MIPDIINGLFELLGGLFILNHCRAVLRDRSVAGVSIAGTVFFFLWGLWNLFYYPHLDQLWSFAGGVLIVIANCLWVGLLIYYRNGDPNANDSNTPGWLDSDLYG